MNSILVWDCSTCKSPTVAFIPQVAKKAKLNFNKILIYAQKAEDIPQDAGNISTLFDAIIRYGPNAIFDIIVDVISYTNKNHVSTFFIISDVQNVWATMFQTIIPENLFVISNTNQQNLLEFSFLSDNIVPRFVSWNDLPTISSLNVNFSKQANKHGGRQKNQKWQQQQRMQFDEEEEEKETSQPTSNNQNNNQDQTEEEEEEERHEQVTGNAAQQQSDSNSDDHDDENANEDEPADDEQSHIRTFSQTMSPVGIKPLTTTETENTIDLRSPLTGNHIKEISSSFTPDVKPKKSNNPVIPRVYQPLIESMKSIGKSMIQLSALTEEIKKTCQQLGVPEQDALSVINQAHNDGYIIFDKTINYIRFRNRALAKTNIEYE